MKTWRTLTIDTLPDAEAVDIPYLDVMGAAPEPRLTVIAGVHGTEYTSIEAVRIFARGLDPAVITGRTVAGASRPGWPAAHGVPPCGHVRADLVVTRTEQGDSAPIRR